MSNQTAAIHPGTYVRESILKPRKLNVTEAAKLVGISRPGFSNFLNGKVSATQDMAARLERVFGIPSKTIIDLQTTYDSQSEKKTNAAYQARSYVPPFLNMQANDIENWFKTTLIARTKFAVLLRMLVHSTGHGILKVDFPGNDDAERPGWDGIIETSSGTPWIPSGISGWEFGVSVDIKNKADGDFIKSVKAIPDNERSEITFVFVTPRRWKGKASWVSSMEAKGLWKDVRAYDCSDLEQWMEQSLAAQTWLANQVGIQSEGVRTLERCWDEWAGVTEPPLHPSLFSTASGTWGEQIKSFLLNERLDPLVIEADSTEEALSFLSQVLTMPDLECYKDKVLVFDQPCVFTKLAQGNTDFIAVAHTREVEREFGLYEKRLRTVVVYPRNASTNPNIVLEPLGHRAFTNALENMGKNRDGIEKLARESGRSLTVLRRRLSKNQAISKPQWANDPDTATELIPLMLVGTWDTLNGADQSVLSNMADDKSFKILEKRIAQLLKINDSPIWSIGKFQGIISKVDVLFAIAGAITKSDLDCFFRVARIVLSEDDPALDLPETERWAAAIHGKQRKYSETVRNGISESLVLLAVHGKNLFGNRLGFDGEQEAAKLVHDLLEPINTRKLEANQDDLPLYAEAAPIEFLNIIERDLRKKEPEVMGLLRPVSSTLFGGSCPRIGLLYALEGLAWSSSTFQRAIKILGQLSEIKITDNYTNKPIGSLSSIFRSWMPQTEADHEMRLSGIRMLLEKHPAIGWEICLKQFGGNGRGIGHYSHKPKWRTDGYGHGEPIKTWGPINDFTKDMIELALTRQHYNASMLCDLVSKLPALSSKDQKRVWEIISKWHNINVTDDEIAIVREKIRAAVLTRRSNIGPQDAHHISLIKKARAVYNAMQPNDVISKYEWLFRQGRIEESTDELSTDEINFEAREKRIIKLRSDALMDIFSEKGIDGVLELAAKGNFQRQIGSYMVPNILNIEQTQDLLLQCLHSELMGLDGIISGAIFSLGMEQWKDIFANLQKKITDEDALRFLLLSPYQAPVWELVEQFPAEISARYWAEVTPFYIFNSPADNNSSIRHLLAAGRPCAAFTSVNFELSKIHPSLLVQMLSAMATAGNERPDEYQLDDYHLQQAFTLLDRNKQIPIEEKAGLEFAYLNVLARPFRGGDGHQIPNLERYINEHPEVFVQAVVWVYKRNDQGEDPLEFRVKDNQKGLTERGYLLLEALERIPGQDQKLEDEQREKLMEWIAIVRKSCSELARLDIADVCLGKLLSNAPVGSDGTWPNKVVRDVMEELSSEDISSGACTGIYNSRGVHSRGEGGSQERELAEKYRTWATETQFTHPFVSSSLLMSIAKTYESEADQHDTEAGVNRRLRH